MKPPTGSAAATPTGADLTADTADAAGGTADAASPAGVTPESADRLALAALSCSEAVEAGGNQPIRLDDPDSTWFVERGALDVFLVERSDSEGVSGLRHALRIEAGGLAFCASRAGAPLVLIARALRGSKLRRMVLRQTHDRDCNDEIAAQADSWISGFAAAVADRIEPRPRPDHLLDPTRPGGRITAETGSTVAARPGGVAWACAEDAEAVAYLGTEKPEDNSTGLIPLTSAAWLTVQSPCRISVVSSLQLQAEGRLTAALADFHDMVLAAEHFNQRLLVVDEINEQTASAAQRRRDEAAAASSLLGILSPSGQHSVERAGSAMLEALRLVGEHEGIAFRPPPRQQRSPVEPEPEPELAAVLNASGVRAREVSLVAEDRWWSGDSGAMLGFRRDDGRPVALLPGKIRRYRVSDPESGRSLRLNAARAAALRREAWCFYPPLPEDRSAQTRDVLRIARVGMGADLARFAAAGMLAGVSTLAPSIAVGALAGWVLPSAARAMLPQTVIAIMAFALLGVLLQMVQGTAMMRIEGRAIARISAALWDRVLRMPTAFFKEFTVGDLTARLFALQHLRDQFSAVVSNSLFSFVFLTPTLGLLFVYDAALAWAAVVAGLASLLVTAAIGLRQFKPQRRRYKAARNLSGELFQFVNGISKLRSAGAEASAFASWARGYRDQQLAVIQINRLNEHLIAFSVAAPALAGAVLFAAALWRGTDHLAVGDFLVVHAVSMTFYLAVTGLGRSFEVIAAALPAYEQLDRLLAAVPETSTPGAAAIRLEGDFRLEHVSFRYSADGPEIIRDVSIHARPGEFIALVGESGAGKSTLLKLALGLENPTAGGVYYDGRDLANLDRRAVRRQIGVVTQSSALQPGDILDNIIGLAGDLTIDDAWKAARLAAVDEDIAAMPMGMFTPVCGSTSTFSGGQTQRIRIAAALVRDPRIVFLDEATNWLDNDSQAKATAGIRSLTATRIMIAHRLSTIREADRIYVLEAGRIAQHGTYQELINTQGPFRQLMQRQIT